MKPLNALIKYKIITVVTLFSSTILLCIGGWFYWQKHVQQVNIQPTRLNIFEFSNENKLKVLQFGIDYFLNSGNFTSIVPYNVQAGFDLKKAKITEIQLDQNSKKYIVTLPPPEILNVDEDEQGETIVAAYDRDKEDDLLKALRVFGQIYARRMALKRHILLKTNDRVKSLLENFYKKLNINVEVKTSPVQDIKAKYISNHLKPLVIEKFQGLEYRPTQYGSLKEGFLYVYDKDNKDNFIKFVSLMEASDYSCKKNSIFNPLIANDIRLCMEKFEPSSYYNIKGYYIGINFLYNGELYSATIHANDKKQLYGFLPRALKVIYSIRPNHSFMPASGCVDFKGYTKEEWERANIHDLRKYLNTYFLYGAFAGSKAITYNDVNMIRANLPYILNVKGIPVITDEDGNSIYDEDQGEFEKTLTGYIEKAQIPIEKVILVVYDHNKILRDRYAFFLKKKVIFYVPGRNFLKILSNREEQKNVPILYKNFSDKTAYTFKNNMQFCFIPENSDLCFDEGLLSNIFRKLTDKGFIHLFTCN